MQYNGYLLSGNTPVAQIQTQETVVKEIDQAILPEENIDREYVANMVLERGRQIEKMEQRQSPPAWIWDFPDF